MPEFPLWTGGQRVEEGGADAATSQGATITANASADTKGTYTQLIASTAFASTSIMVYGAEVPTANTDFLLDIAIGAAASEVVILSNLYFGAGQGSVIYGNPFIFPIAIPAGTRISARVQSDTGSETITVNVHLIGQGFLPAQPLSIVDTYGANTADTGGVSVDSGSSADTKGAYSEVVASTTRDMREFTVAIGNQVNGIRASYVWLFDIAIGAAASEVIIVPDIALACSSTSDILFPHNIRVPLRIPAGTRIAARSQCSGTNSADRLFDVFVYGVG